MVGGSGGSLSKSGGCENFMLQVDFFFFQFVVYLLGGCKLYVYAKQNRHCLEILGTFLFYFILFHFIFHILLNSHA